jgi:NNP family nitrate/nitrite transporter-like MFS transporter
MILDSGLMTLPFGSPKIAVVGVIILAISMGFANAAVFKLVPKYMLAAVGGTAGMVGGLGAFGGFVIPVLMGLFVDVAGTSGYSYGFSIFLILSVISLILFIFVRASHAAPREEI